MGALAWVRLFCFQGLLAGRICLAWHLKSTKPRWKAQISPWLHLQSARLSSRGLRQLQPPPVDFVFAIDLDFTTSKMV
jgi:hypothetical protein